MEWLKYSRHYAKHTFTKILSSTIIILILQTELGMKFGHREVAAGEEMYWSYIIFKNLIAVGRDSEFNCRCFHSV